MPRDPRKGRKPASRSTSAKKRKPALDPAEQLRLGVWLSRLDKKQVDVVAGTGLSKGYVNNLINPKDPTKPPNPSVIAMLRISRFLNVTINMLFEEPPTKEVVDEYKKLHPAQIAAGIRPDPG